MKKRRQIDSLMDMPQEKRPPDHTIWWGTPEALEAWIDKVYDHKHNPADDEISFIIPGPSEEE